MKSDSTQHSNFAGGCEHGIDILPPYKVDRANVFPKRCLFTHPADKEDH